MQSLPGIDHHDEPREWTLKKTLYPFALILLLTLVLLTLGRLWDRPETSSEIHSTATRHRETDGQHELQPGFSVPRKKNPLEKRRSFLPDVSALEKRGTGGTAVPLVEVTVVDERTGSQIEGAKVVVLDRATRKERLSEVTDLQGRVTLRLDSGQYWVTAHHDHYLSNETAVSLSSKQAGIRRTLGLRAVSKVTGFLRNQYRKTVANARISFWQKEDSREEGSYSTTYTRQDGFFELDVAPGSYVVQIVKLPSETMLESPVLLPAPAPLELTLHEESNLVNLLGTVVDSDAVPVANADVLVQRGSKPWPRLIGQSKTGATGEFDMRVPQGEANISVQARGYREHEEVLTLLRNSRKRIVLQEFKAFTVRAYDSRGQRIENAIVLGRSIDTSKAVVRSLSDDPKKSDEKLFYSTEYPFEIHATSFNQALGFTETRIVENYQPSIELRSSGQGQLSVYVADEAGRPIRDFAISLEQYGFQRSTTRVYTNDGHFSFGGIPDGNYTVAVKAETYRSQHKTVDVREQVPGSVEVVLFERKKGSENGMTGSGVR